MVERESGQVETGAADISCEGFASTSTTTDTNNLKISLGDDCKIDLYLRFCLFVRETFQDLLQLNDYPT